MAHTISDKKRILARVNRLKGQLDALANAVDSDQDCYKVMQLLASCRGALHGLMGDIINNHIREHIVDAANKKDASRAGDELIEIMESFWK